MKRGSVGGAITSSRTLFFPFLSSKIRLSPLLGMNGNGCAGSIACGVSTGKICSRNCLSSQVSASSSSGRPRRRAGHIELGLQLRPDLMLARHQPVGLGDDRGKLLSDGQPIDRALLDAERLMGLEAGDPHHEEFVEALAEIEEAELEQRGGVVAGPRGPGG